MDIDVTDFVVRSRSTGEELSEVRAGFIMVKTTR
jgi:hypothetical protein